MQDCSQLEIDLGALRQNVASWRRLLTRCASGDRGGARFCAVVKADAYGLGATRIAAVLGESGVDMLAVYSAAQAAALCASGVTTPVLVMMPVQEVTEPALLEPLRRHRLHLTAHDRSQLQQLDRIGRRSGVAIPIHLYLDTGMSRGGFNREQFPAAVASLRSLRHVTLAGVFTHFVDARADVAMLEAQNECFGTALREASASSAAGQSLTLHAANTYAACRDVRYHHGMVRIGLGLYGYGPDQLGGGEPHAALGPLTHAVRWVSRLVHVQRYPAGATVGYSATCTLGRDSLLGLVPVGYGDGYPLGLSNRGAVTVAGHAAPICGKVNMDQIVVDLTDLPKELIEREPPAWEEVELISADPASPCALPRLAELADSNCYELLCRISPRVKRIYRDVEPARPVEHSTSVSA